MMKKQKGVTLVEMVICVFGIGALAVGVALVYSLFHFIAKFW